MLDYTLLHPPVYICPNIQVMSVIYFMEYVRTIYTIIKYCGMLELMWKCAKCWSLCNREVESATKRRNSYNLDEFYLTPAAESPFLLHCSLTSTVVSWPLSLMISWWRDAYRGNRIWIFIRQHKIIWLPLSIMSRHCCNYNIVRTMTERLLFSLWL